MTGLVVKSIGKNLIIGNQTEHKDSRLFNIKLCFNYHI